MLVRWHGRWKIQLAYTVRSFVICFSTLVHTHPKNNRLWHLPQLSLGRSSVQYPSRVNDNSELLNLWISEHGSGDRSEGKQVGSDGCRTVMEESVVIGDVGPEVHMEGTSWDALGALGSRS